MPTHTSTPTRPGCSVLLSPLYYHTSLVSSELPSPGTQEWDFNNLPRSGDGLTWISPPCLQSIIITRGSNPPRFGGAVTCGKIQTEIQFSVNTIYTWSLRISLSNPGSFPSSFFLFCF
ncbi:hypothetical protein M406DRAFT_56505 [Cryphonectria parasitica EP155]|uniref:Uncharacterized protein n=1 Tax=Cryphonectria parasitica (strain ATCC 38755 / EP155) TaxID=660469 RepID=A0A9P4XWL9_CRYP1|nr:uncharacterized protein M406DRAFT_56505 [Cryphonectria parasitica EP155]KAF3762162.1 hypothetical protein M406DRAFT_56505 [Cryphonectria parasitica EP155]